MELTKEHFDQAVKGLATRQSVDDLAVKVVAVEDLLNNHTTTLDAIAKNTNNWEMEMTVMRDRMKRYEDALKTVGEKLNLDLRAFLH